MLKKTLLIEVPVIKIKVYFSKFNKSKAIKMVKV